MLDQRPRANAWSQTEILAHLAEWVIHDLSHLRQLVMAAAEAFLPAAGPWRPAYPHLELGAAA